MTNRVRSAKGEHVDFDLLRIKEQIAASPAPQDVRARQDFIEKRLRRRLKKVPAPAPKIEEGANTEPTANVPGTETLSKEIEQIDVELEEVEEKKTTTRQKTRPPKK